MSEKVRAKFVCESVESDESGNKQLLLRAVYGTDGENADFTKYTPAGEVRMTITEGVPAADFFTEGAEFYADFSRAE